MSGKCPLETQFQVSETFQLKFHPVFQLVVSIFLVPIMSTFILHIIIQAESNLNEDNYNGHDKMIMMVTKKIEHKYYS